MSTVDVYSAIKTFLDANFTTVPCVYENTDTPLSDTPSAFVYAEISGTAYFQASTGGGLGDNLFRENGLLWLHVMVTSGSGSITARTYAKTLVELFREAELLGGSLVFNQASVGLGEPGTEDGNYWRLSISIEWELETE
jgi:hypothetical protein